MNEPDANRPPRHVAIIMDGNGRWAAQQGEPRHQGHRAGAEAVRNTVETCARAGIQALTLFAFSSENWRRPATEVRMLMQLFARVLERETHRLHENGIELKIIGDRTRLPPKIQESAAAAESLTAGNARMRLNIAASYGGRWDIVQAVQQLAAEVARGERNAHSINEQAVQDKLCLSDLPEPDLFVRTGGEQRISNFLLWQLAYTELYFTPVLWPEFSATQMQEALDWYAGRQRRFGRVNA